MPRLPIPGHDDDSWGKILNNYLSTEHNPDGTLKKAGNIAKAQSDAKAAQAGLQAHLRASWCNVKSFGAKGDGLTDDTPAIQAAIDKAAETAKDSWGGGTVFLPSGLYLISSTLTLKKHVWLRGEGMLATTVQLTRNANCHIIQSQAATSESGSNADELGLFDMCLDGNRANQDGNASYHGVYLQTFPRTYAAAGDSYFDMHHTIVNVRVQEVKGDGFHFYGRSATQVINAFARNCGRYGFNSTFDLNLSHCESDGAGKDGFYLHNGSVRLSVCKSFLSGQEDGVGAGYRFAEAANEITLSACEAQNNNGAGFFVDRCSRISLNGCVAASNNVGGKGFAGFELHDSSFCTIMGISSQGKQNNIQIGGQAHALRMQGSSSANTILLSHSASNNAGIGSALAAETVLTDSHVIINGQVQ